MPISHKLNFKRRRVVVSPLALESYPFKRAERPRMDGEGEEESARKRKSEVYLVDTLSIGRD
jgi:hypothetical protein